MRFGYRNAPVTPNRYEERTFWSHVEAHESAYDDPEPAGDPRAGTASGGNSSVAGSHWRGSAAPGERGCDR